MTVWVKIDAANYPDQYLYDPQKVSEKSAAPTFVQTAIHTKNVLGLLGARGAQ